MTNKKTSVGDSRKSTKITRLLPYGVAFLTVALALELTQLLLPWLYSTTTPLFFVAVMVSAWYGGLRAGLLATILSTLAINYFFIEPINSFQIANIGTIARLSAFLMTAGLISSLTQSRLRALNKAQEALQTLQETIEREQAAKEQLETVLSSINEGVYVVDHDWRFTYVNDRYCEMIEMGRSAILGQNVWELFPAAIGTEADAQFRRAIREQTPLQFDYFYAPWNCWHDHRIYPSSNGLTVFLADITERKQAELMLVEQKRLLELIASGQPLDDCLSALCNSVSRLSPGTRACFLLVDAQRRTFPRSITPDLPSSFSEGIKDTPINDLCIGTCGEAVYRGQPITCAHIANDDHWSQEWRDLCLAHGILACHSKPVIGIDQRPFGSLMLCFDEARMPTDWEHQLAEFGVQVASIVFDRDRSILAVRESEERLSLAIEGADMVTWDADLQTGKTIWSANLFRILGYEPLMSGEATIEMWQSRIHPDDLANVMQAWEIAKEERSLYNPEYRIIRADNGQIVWVAATGRFYYDQLGQAVRFVGVTFDVSERKQIEAELQQSNDRFYAAMRAVEGIVFEWNLQTNTVYRSEGLFQLIGVRAEDASPTQEWWAERVHPDDMKRFEADFPSIIASRDRYEGEYRVRHEAGYWVDVWERGYLQRNSQGELIGVVGFTTDVSDRKRAEKALRESEERFRTLADNMSQLAWMTDETGWIFWYNQRWFEYTGTTLEDMQGWGWQKVHHPDHVDRVVAHIRHCFETGESWEDIFPLRGQDGTYRWFLSRALPIRDEKGHITRWFGTNTDITERRQYQLQLQEQAQQLMQLNSDLRQSSEILAKRNQELDQFVYVVSHDLKAPLRAIANLSQWLEDDLAGQLPEENQHQMELLRQRVHRLEDFIDGLLAYSRVGRTEVAEETVSIGELLCEILDSLAPPVSFTIEVKPPMPSVVTKRLLLTQVFSNLISNAIKHHHRPDGKIIVSATEKRDGYEFIICDDGPGIAPEHHEKIFGIFQTLKAINTKDSTGIGLSIVKKILETEGGAIALESKLGMGTTFRFTWPKQPKTYKDEMANSN